MRSGIWNERLGPDAVYLVCTHADVLATIALDAVGSHFDQIHRLSFSPASVSVIRYGPAPTVVRLNDDGTGPRRPARTAETPRPARVGGLTL